MFVYVVVCLLAFVSNIVILSVLIPTCYHRTTFVVFSVVNVFFLVVCDLLSSINLFQASGMVVCVLQQMAAK